MLMRLQVRGMKKKEIMKGHVECIHQLVGILLIHRFNKRISITLTDVDAGKMVQKCILISFLVGKSMKGSVHDVRSAKGC